MQPLSESSLNVPAFLGKLWKMVNDPSTDHLICWGPSGTSFIIQNQAQFWYELLPVYYKHNNMSSFVRQLNMYGFHKMSTIENGTLDVDKDEIQFFHQYFQRDKPELMKQIKRKVTGSSKTSTVSLENTNQTNIRTDDISKVLTDVKYIKGKQNSVDSQLSAMKQENAVLWRELALLRQKHMKQQQIVNKLIQFLVTIVQPPGRMGGLGVKRHFPLMLNASPAKKVKPNKPESTTSEGPIIHELDSDILQEELLSEADRQEMQAANEDVVNTDMLLDSSELMDNEVGDLLQSDSELQDEISNNLGMDNRSNDNKVFLNPATQDTLLSNLMNGSYNTNTIKDRVKSETPCETGTDEPMTVATRDHPALARLNSVEDLDLHLENTQNELDQLKDLLNGCSTFDANALLGLFNDESPTYGISCNKNEEINKNDTLVPTSEPTLLLTTNSIDFSQLFDEPTEEQFPTETSPVRNIDSKGSITTPQVSNDAPQFPPSTSSKPKK